MGEGLADRYRNSPRWTELLAAGQLEPVEVPSGTVAEVVAWADTPAKKAAALAAELAGKNRKSLIDALS